MIKILNISDYIQPYLPRYLITDYYKDYFELCLIDIIYYYFNHPDLYDEKSIRYKDVKDIISYHNSYHISCNAYDDVYDHQVLKEKDLYKGKYIIDSYKDELNRVENIYTIYQTSYCYDELKIYKNAHLSYELGKRDTRSCCNIKEFIKNKLCKKYFEDKLQHQFNKKKIKEEDKTVIFILDIIDKLFRNYIDSLKYGIHILQNRPYMINYGEEYLPKIYENSFIEKDKVIHIKHLGFINNIVITNSSNQRILNKGYVKLFRPKKSDKIVIWFE